MNSEISSNKIKQLLDSTTMEISPAALESLRASRTLALKRQRTLRSPVLNWVYAHTGGLPAFSHFVTRPVNMMIASAILLATLMVSYNYVQHYLNEDDITDVDLAILTDDMPLHVYVD